MLRRRHEQRMQRIDADEIRAGRRGDLGEARQVLEIADAPIALGAKAIELAGDAPAASVLQPVGQEAAMSPPAPA